MIKAVLFDLDGVLVDATEWHYHSLNRALQQVVGYEISREDHLTKYNGLPTKNKLEKLGITGLQFDLVWSLKQKFTIDIIKENEKVDLVKIDLLSFLKSQNIKIACVTNSIRETASLMLSSTGQIGYFDLLVSNEDVVKNKPQPDPYDTAIRLLDVSPESVLIVEDSPVGIQSASLSKAGVIWKVHSPHDVTKNNFVNLFFGENS